MSLMMRVSKGNLLTIGLGGLCCLLVGAAIGPAAQEPANADRPEGSETPEEASSNAGWLVGTIDEKFAQIERHLRGLDVSMAEIGDRYGELLEAAQLRNWDHARYQTEKIDLSLRLAIERRPKRAESSEPFLETDLRRVLEAIERQDGEQLDRSLVLLHEACVACHQKEEVLYFQDAVGRIRDRAMWGDAEPPADAP